MGRVSAVERDKSCTCPKAEKELGRLYGISMGRGVVRLSDDPDCPEHGNGEPRG